MKPPMPMPMSRSASSTLTPAMMPRKTFVVSRFIPILLSRPASLGSAASHVAQRPPSFIRDIACLLDSATHSGQFAHHIVELRLDLVADAPAVFGQIQPAPHTAEHGPHAGRHQDSRSLIHGSSLHFRARLYSRQPHTGVSKDMPQLADRRAWIFLRHSPIRE